MDNAAINANLYAKMEESFQDFSNWLLKQQPEEILNHAYSKKYLAEHEADIFLHKAAKKYFDDQGLEKLPTFKSLQSEYSELMAQKKAMYSDYKKAQEKMRELQTAKANVDKILNMEIPESEKGKEAEQR